MNSRDVIIAAFCFLLSPSFILFRAGNMSRRWTRITVPTGSTGPRGVSWLLELEMYSDS
jgi:hypothetical protein